MISVALCTYNGERYVRQQLESILSQTLPVSEVVICDDGSTDNTVQIVKGIAHDSSVSVQIYPNEKTLGVCANFQKAVDLCHGDIIFLSDQDDVWHADKVEITVDYFNSHHDKQVVFTDARLITPDGAPTGEHLWDYTFHSFYRQQFDNHLAFECFINGNHATGATMAIRKEFAGKHPFAQFCTEGMLHDHVIALQAVMLRQLGYINLPLIDYRTHPEQQVGVKYGTKQPPANNYHAALYVDLPNYNVLTDKYYVQRVDFLKYRIGLKHKVLAPVSIFLCQRSNYRRFYREEYFQMMKYDAHICMNHSLKRILSKIQRVWCR